MKQFAIILGVTCVGEIIKYLVPLPIPGSIYGLILMMVLLMTKAVKVEDVKETAEFLIEIMPLMFIPAGVGLLTAWNQIQAILVPIIIITIVSTFLVMVVSGKVTDKLLDGKRGGQKNE